MNSAKIAIMFACAGFLTHANTAHAEDMDFVSDKALCGKELIDRAESGMTLRASFTTTIEYGCEFEPLDPID